MAVTSFPVLMIVSSSAVVWSNCGNPWPIGNMHKRDVAFALGPVFKDSGYVVCMTRFGIGQVALHKLVKLVEEQ